MRRTASAAALLLAAAAFAAAGEPSAYTLEDCIRIGRERSIRLANAKRDETIAQADVRQVRAQALPSLSAKAGYSRLDEVPVIPAIGEAMGREDNYTASVDAEQLLYSGGGVSAALKAARLYREFSRLDVERADARLVRDIRRGFYDILYAQAAVAVSAESVRHLDEFVRQTELKYSQQTVSEFDLLSARVRLSNEKPKLVKAENDLALARTSFRNLIGLDEDDFWLAGDWVFEPVAAGLEESHRVARERRPELRQAEAVVSMREQDIRVSRSDYFPEVRAFGSYAGTNPGSSAPTEDEWEWHWTAGLNASWSFLDGGKRSAELLAKHLKREKARAELEDLQRNIRLEVENAWQTVRHAAQVVEGSQQGVDLAERALEIARVRYEQGLSTYLEFADSNLALSHARLIHEGALREYLTAVADLRYACGTDELPAGQEARP